MSHKSKPIAGSAAVTARAEVPCKKKGPKAGPTNMQMRNYYSWSVVVLKLLFDVAVVFTTLLAV